MAQKELINLSVTNAIITIIHPIIAPSGFDLKPSLDSKSSMSVSASDLGTMRQALNGDIASGKLNQLITLDFQLLPDSDAVQNFFTPLYMYEDVNGKTMIPFLYITYGSQRVKHVLSKGTLMNYSPLASFQEDAQNQNAQIIFGSYAPVRI